MQGNEYINLGHNHSNGICSHLVLLYLQSLADCFRVIFINLVRYLIIQIQHAVKISKIRDFMHNIITSTLNTP